MTGLNHDHLKMVLGGLLLVFSMGCTQQATPVADDAEKFEAINEWTEQQTRQKKVALEAKERLFNSLLKELGESLAQNGPAKSISVCKDRAPKIALDVQNETGVKIGRTSHKLRNNKNVVPKWAAKFVRDQVENEVAVKLPEESLGLLLPIRLMPTCTLCHGKKQQIMPAVRSAIEANYPNDRATGFEIGDIRGYFWMEVPKDVDETSGDSKSR